MRPTLTLLGVAVLLALAPTALAVPPTLSSVTHQARHPAATFAAPRAGSVTIYLASKPDRATDGSFLFENVKEVELLTDSEIQSGRWLDENRIDPGTYWVMLRASPNFDSCYIFDAGTFDPACADGFSNVVTLVVEKPAVRYAARVTAYRSLREASLQLTATPLGEARPYRVCYRLKNRKTRCLSGTLAGFSWDDPAVGTLTVSTRNLPSIVTFSWFVGSTRVASKRVRVR